MSISELKEICNKLVGTWYCEEMNEYQIFDLNESFFSTESKLTVINSTNNYKSFNISYGVGIYLGGEIENETKFYIDIGLFNKRYYIIEEISYSQLVLREYWMSPNIPPSEKINIYKTTSSPSVADDILRGLDLS